MRYRVSAIAIDVSGGKFILAGSYSLEQPYVEVIDTEGVKWFKGCQNIQDIETAYEEYWNYPNGGWALHNLHEKVKVLLVERLLDS